MSSEMVREFFYAVAVNSGMNLHIKVLTNGNIHHLEEPMFKLITNVANIRPIRTSDIIANFLFFFILFHFLSNKIYKYWHT